MINSYILRVPVGRGLVRISSLPASPISSCFLLRSLDQGFVLGLWSSLGGAGH